MKAFIQRNWFVLGLPCAVALAWIVPEAGASGGWLRPEITTRIAVAVIFVSQGMTLPASALAHGARRWKLHVLVQSFTFGIFPLLGLALDAAIGGRLPPDLRLGLLYLCVLPSTVSMSVVLTTLAGGNTAGAIFNAVFSNVLGVFVTPVWAAWLMRTGGEPQPLGPVIREIVVLLLLPLVAGQAARVWLGGWADRRRKLLGNLNSAMILYIVFAAFCNSVQSHVWTEFGFGLTFEAFALVALIFTVATLLAASAATVLRLDRGDRIVAIFCGPQKTLASGVPLAKVIFGANPGLGLILLPIMLYHPLQLVVCGVMAGRWAKRAPRE